MNNHLTKFCRKENKNKFRFLSNELDNKNEEEEDMESNNCSSTGKADLFNFNQKKVYHRKRHQNEVINEWFNYIENLSLIHI